MTPTEPAPEPPEPPGRLEGLEHLSSRPTWDCLTCGQPWPCDPARDKLLKEFHGFPSVLTIYMSAQMYDAVGDLISSGHFAPANLFDRFIAWARKAAVDPDGRGPNGWVDEPQLHPQKVASF